MGKLLAFRRRRRRSRRTTTILLTLALAALAMLIRTSGDADRVAPSGDLSGAVPGRSAAPQARPAVSARNPHAARFGLCASGGGVNCVVDGDTFWFASDKYRIADIDTPETHPARCAAEQRLGDAATRRLRALLSDGAFALQPIDRDTDRYGRRLRIVTRDGVSIGDALIAEGLARPYVGGPRAGWC